MGFLIEMFRKFYDRLGDAQAAFKKVVRINNLEGYQKSELADRLRLEGFRINPVLAMLDWEPPEDESLVGGIFNSRMKMKDEEYIVRYMAWLWPGTARIEDEGGKWMYWEEEDKVRGVYYRDSDMLYYDDPVAGQEEKEREKEICWSMLWMQ